MRVKKKNIDAIEFYAVDFRFGGQVEHGVEIEAWFRAGTAFADQAWPHGIVQLRKIIRRFLCHAHMLYKSRKL
jgi:hypothetical protein